MKENLEVIGYKSNKNNTKKIRIIYSNENQKDREI